MIRAAHYMLCLSLSVLAFVAAAPPAHAAADTIADESISLLLMDVGTGRLLYAQAADVKRPPASMLKLMLMLLVAEGIDRGDWTLDTVCTASALAQSMGGTQVYLKAGETFTLGQLMPAIAVCSANDASVAVAESLWGSVPQALKAMNARAAQLGMHDTIFYSVNGLPPDPGKPFDQTTAYDMALLGRASVQNEYMRYWTGLREYALRPGTAPKANTNKLMQRMPECEGLKTGFIRAAGFCITATARKGDLYLLAVVMGCPTSGQRFDLAETLFRSGFNQVQRVQIASANAPVGPPLKVLNGDPEFVRVGFDEPLDVVVTARERATLELVPRHFPDLQAPLAPGTPVGELEVRANNVLVARRPLHALEAVQPRGWWLQVDRGTARWAGLETRMK